MQDMDFRRDIDAINRIPAVQAILDVVCRTTGMGFAAVARVTEDRWVACSVLDRIDFGLKPGGELEIGTTICNEIRQPGKAVVIDDVTGDEKFRRHRTPAMYGFQSYISVPITLMDGTFFGTLCAIDPAPAKIDTPAVTGMFALFADLIAAHLNASEKLEQVHAALLEHRRESELREQFVAVLGHDLRNPLSAISGGAQLLKAMQLNDRAHTIATMIHDSALRMSELIENVLDFTRGRLGGGIGVRRDSVTLLEPALMQVIDELRTSHPGRAIDVKIDLHESINCDVRRIAQLFSNLLGNALTHGAQDEPVRVRAFCADHVFELSVANGGMKIPAASMDHLFRPFARGDLGANQQGLGLGLYIASEIAGAHEGMLGVASTDAETVFTFRMPTQAIDANRDLMTRRRGHG